MKYLIIILLAFCIVSCTSTKFLSDNQVTISQSEWAMNDSIEGITPNLRIEENKIYGNSGCNTYFGELTLDKSMGTFLVKNVGSTRKACPNMSVENNFLQLLGEANRYVVNGNQLELYKDKLILLKFNKK